MNHYWEIIEGICNALRIQANEGIDMEEILEELKNALHILRKDGLAI